MRVEFKQNMREIDEKAFLITLIGILTLIEKNVLTIDEAEKFVFSPRVVRELSNRNCNKDIISIVEKGCELEDIVSLIPETFKEVIEDLKEETLLCIKKYETYDKFDWFEE